MSQKPDLIPPSEVDKPRRFKFPKIKPWVGGMAGGVGLGLLSRLLFDAEKMDFIYDGIFAEVMSFTFIFILPTLIGALSVALADDKTLEKKTFAFFQPMLTILVFLLTTFITNLEGLICIAMVSPLWLPLGGLGGLASRWITKRIRSRRKELLTFIVLAPFLLSAGENTLPIPEAYHDVVETRVIPASNERIWKELTDVGALQPGELEGGFLHWIGIIHPMKASEAFDGPGSRRIGYFEGDIAFEEEITEWEPGRKFTFTIEIDPNDIPPTTLDEHVLVGGKYYDLLSATFVLAPQEDGSTEVSFSSHHRVSTHINGYMRLWLDGIMGSFQEDFLNLLEKRSVSPDPGM